MKFNVVNTKNVHSTQRFDPSFHLSDAIILREKVENVPFEQVSVADATENVFLGNIFSRIFVKDAEHGIPYLAASDTVLANLNTGRYLSKKTSICFVVSNAEKRLDSSYLFWNYWQCYVY